MIRWLPNDCDYEGFDEYKRLTALFRARMGYSYKPHRTKEYTLNVLQHYAELRVLYKKGMTNAEARDKFLKQKKAKKLFTKLCFSCGEQCQHRHHVIQIQNGGRNDGKNVIPICISCHEEIHPWMKTSN